MNLSCENWFHEGYCHMYYKFWGSEAELFSKFYSKIDLHASLFQVLLPIWVSKLLQYFPGLCLVISIHEQRMTWRTIFPYLNDEHMSNKVRVEHQPATFFCHRLKMSSDEMWDSTPEMFEPLRKSEALEEMCHASQKAVWMISLTPKNVL